MLPKDVQETYIKRLQDEFHVTAVLICRMLGIAVSTLSRHIELNDLNVRFIRGRKQTKEQQEQWENFLHGIQDEPSGHEFKNEDTECETQQPSKSGFMKGFTISFAGQIDVEAIANSLFQTNIPIQRKAVFGGDCDDDDAPRCFWNNLLPVLFLARLGKLSFTNYYSWYVRFRDNDILPANLLRRNFR